MGFRICLATNFAESWLQHLLSTVEEPPFDACLVSSVVGIAKPHPMFWQLLLRIVPPGTIFVDDQHANCVGASQAGLAAICPAPDASLEHLVLEAHARAS